MHDEWYVCKAVEIYADFRFGVRVSATIREVCYDYVP